ncbi:MAG: branched-chain amino acid ABC transporter permease [Syntrophobacteraceae bacterium]
MMTGRKSAYLYIAAIFAIGVVAPLVLRQYQVNMLTEIILFALFAVSYNLLLGYAGLLSFGHAMFFGLGAFATAIAMIRIPGISLWGAIAAAVLITTAVSFLVGALFLRHKGAYFSLLTLAFNALFYAVATKWNSLTGGDDGLSITLPALNLGFGQVKIAPISNFYYFTLTVVGGAIVFCWYFTRTAMGHTILLMRENEERMKFLGYNTNITRLLLFTFTGAVAGLAGSFYTLHFQFVSISAVSIDMTTAVLLMTFVGGTRTFWGPVVGSFVYIVLQNYLSDITDRWQIWMGLIFILMVLLIPGGISQIVLSVRDFIAGRTRGGQRSAAREA